MLEALIDVRLNGNTENPSDDRSGREGLYR